MPVQQSRYLVFVTLLAIACPAAANMVWPAMYLESRLLTWWAVSAGLLIEFVALRLMFGLPPLRTAIATLGANVASALLGIPLIPLAGVLWEIFPGSIYMRVLDWGTFNPVTWVASFALACLINAGVEGLLLKRGFLFPFRKRHFWLLVLANSLSVGAALASLFIVPIDP